MKDFEFINVETIKSKINYSCIFLLLLKLWWTLKRIQSSNNQIWSLSCSYKLNLSTSWALLLDDELNLKTFRLKLNQIDFRTRDISSTTHELELRLSETSISSKNNSWLFGDLLFRFHIDFDSDRWRANLELLRFNDFYVFTKYSIPGLFQNQRLKLNVSLGVSLLL